MTTNDNAKRILCFGDSNTWGYIFSTKHERYLPSERWTGALQKLLGEGYEIIEEGLNSRGIVHGDNRPGKEGRSSVDYIVPCLDTHDPLDYIIILLGTNELKQSLNLTPEAITENLEVLVKIIRNRESQFRDIRPKIILLAPPLVNDQSDYCRKDDKYKSATVKSKALGSLYKKLADKYDLAFLDLAPITSVGEDGIHLTKEAHQVVAEEIYKLF